MKADEFATVFDAEIRVPLVAVGFQSAAKSLFLVEGYGCLSLIRLGGRLASPGGVSHILCFRHTFLRTRDKVIPRGFMPDVSDYPYKLRLADFAVGCEPRYNPQNLGHWHFDRFEFAAVPMAMLRERLHRLRSVILDHVVPWSHHMSPHRACAEIQQHGEDAWIERIWLQDYSKHLSKKAGVA